MIYIPLCHLSFVFNNIKHHIWQSSPPPKKLTLMQAYKHTTSYTHTLICHTFSNPKDPHSFIVPPAIFKSLDEVCLPPAEGSQPASGGGQRAVRLWVWGLVEGGGDGNDGRFQAGFSHLQCPTHSCWELDPSSVLCRVSWSVLWPCSLWGIAWTSSPQNCAL